jgi:hypothetical protein
VEAVGAEEVGAEVAGGDAGSAGFGCSASRRRKTGGPSCSSSSRSRGLASARCAADAGFDPAAIQVPAPAQVLFGPCNAPVTVNSPSEAPVRSASYTVPDSKAMGTGAAL